MSASHRPPAGRRAARARALGVAPRCLALSALLHALYILFGAGPPSAPPAPPPPPPIRVVDFPPAVDAPVLPPPLERPRLPELYEPVASPEPALEPPLRIPFAPPGPPASAVRPPEPDDGPRLPEYDVAPEALRMVRPGYPELARAAGAEGTVLIEVTVSESGRVIEAVVVRSAVIRSLEEAALEAARASLFRPARQRGVPVKARMLIPYRFELD